MTEAPQSAAAIEAQRQGLEFAGFAKYRDPKTGQIVARVVGDELVPVEGDESQPGGFGTTGATTDTGNPTGDGFMGPADRARQMGLQSDGSGGYVDPSTGQVVARTVNNELVFYSPQGGAVSDGAGGEQLTQPSPSWVDPVTGELMVPPAQPESPEEKMAVPASVPALAPASYNMFMNFKRKQMYKQNYEQMNAQQDIDGQQAEVDDLYSQHPAMGKLLNDMKGIIERANATGDKDKMAVATILQDALADIADEIGSSFNDVKEEDHEELSSLLRRRSVARAKKQHYEDSRPEGSRRASDNPAPFEYWQSGRDAKGYQDEINQIADRNTELEKTPKFQKVPKEVSDGGIRYKIEPKKDRLHPKLDVKANDALREAGQNYRVGEKPKVYTVDWDVEGADEEMDAEGNRRELGPQESKRKALTALRTWRNEVLPRFSPGTIVHAEPMKEEGEGQYENQRERIYQLAGFGSNHGGPQIPGMYGVVIENEDGVNELVPVMPTKEQKNKRTTQMESVYIRMNDHNLNTVDTDVIVEMLLS